MPTMMTRPGMRTSQARIASAAMTLPRVLAGHLEQISDLIERLSDAQYVDRFQELGSGSIGAHVRHTLDHLTALLYHRPPEPLDYDRRERGTAVESDRAVALRLLSDYAVCLTTSAPIDPDESIQVRMLIAPHLPEVLVPSTTGREFTFVLSHTIHHQAMLGVAARLLEVSLPNGFGYAPATIRSWE